MEGEKVMLKCSLCEVEVEEESPTLELWAPYVWKNDVEVGPVCPRHKVQYHPEECGWWELLE